MIKKNQKITVFITTALIILGEAAVVSLAYHYSRQAYKHEVLQRGYEIISKGGKAAFLDYLERLENPYTNIILRLTRATNKKLIMRFVKNLLKELAKERKARENILITSQLMVLSILIIGSAIFLILGKSILPEQINR